MDFLVWIIVVNLLPLAAVWCLTWSRARVAIPWLGLATVTVGTVPAFSSSNTLVGEGTIGVGLGWLATTLYGLIGLVLVQSLAICSASTTRTAMSAGAARCGIAAGFCESKKRTEGEARLPCGEPSCRKASSLSLPSTHTCHLSAQVYLACSYSPHRALCSSSTGSPYGIDTASPLPCELRAWA